MSSKSTFLKLFIMAAAAFAVASAGCTDEKVIRTNNGQNQSNNSGNNNKNNNQKKNNNNNNNKKKPAAFDVAFYATSNPTGAGSDYIVGLDSKLENAANLYKLANVRSIQSIAFDDDGDALVTYDAENNSDGGLMKFGNLPAKSSDRASISPRKADGTSDAPKGLLWVKDRNDNQLNFDALIVADVGDSNDGGSIRVYNVDNGQPVLAFTNDNLGEANKKIWDVAYDEDADRLFATRTDGILLLYNNFFQQGVNAQPAQITPVDENGNKISINLHGIVYDADEDLMVLSDVGDPKKADDGKIFVFDEFIDNAAANMQPTGIIAGSNTKLGNPVDIIVKDDDLYVAEKSNDLILKFDDIDDLDEERNVAADDSLKVIKPESLAIKPD